VKSVYSPCEITSLLHNHNQNHLHHPTAIEINCSTYTIPLAAYPNMSKSYSSSYKVLTFDQFTKLDKLMNSDIEIHGQGTFPNIKVALKDFVVSLKSKLQKADIPLDSVRLNGGAASHVVGMRQMIDDIGYNDLDLIFGLSSEEEEVFENVRQLLYATLRGLLPDDDETGEALRLSDSVVDDGYVQKMVKVCNNNDCWSLISLYNNDGQNVEVKFVHRMKRQYEFSVDSFQIELDSFLSYYEFNTDESPPVKFTKDFYPTVMAESKYGKFDEALFHLNNKLVATLRPEEIRGGGLLKYCNLLLNGYNIADSDIKNMQRYMCSRFFIDFPDANSQQNKLQSYLRTHLRKAPKSSRVAQTQQPRTPNNGETQTNDTSTISENKENVQNLRSHKEKVDDGSLEQHRINFLLIVRKIIDDSTVCLMNIERACTLNLLDSMIADFLRAYLLKNEGKFPLDVAESGYFSENSSVSNSLPSPSHFSRSSSPSMSMNGTSASAASRSSSPAAAFGMASRLSPMDLAALTVSGGFLHPVSATPGVHFAPQMFPQFASNIQTLSLVNSVMTSHRGDQSGLVFSHQHANGGNQGHHNNHNGGQYQYSNQYTHHHNTHSRSNGHGRKGGGHYKGGNNQNYHHHGNHSHFYHSNNQMSGGGHHHHYLSNSGGQNGANHYSNAHYQSQHYNGAYSLGRNNNNNNNTGYYNSTNNGGHYNQYTCHNHASNQTYFTSQHVMAASTGHESDDVICMSNNRQISSPNQYSPSCSSNQIEDTGSETLPQEGNDFLPSLTLSDTSRDECENISLASPSSSVPAQCQSNPGQCHDQTTPVILAAY